ncbi:hypothetical protein JOF56_009030 [Kibdelosporangium banguiense]|uniref:DUF5642 domain-containing protein n=1 Tax=Kibdelosporangium banguiense TaxID=1365924 RepID=A0ABS4TW80_9PSEU|nr:hypothetical protein [Kibdelosporangium banguiense]MBP2328645.1 hypothetical protein [Kibdelosporangium banguiense]
MGRALGARHVFTMTDPQKTSGPNNAVSYTCNFSTPDRGGWLAALTVTTMDTTGPNSRITDLKVCPPNATPVAGVGDIASYCATPESTRGTFGAMKIAHGQQIGVTLFARLPEGTHDALRPLVKQVIDAQ